MNFFPKIKECPCCGSLNLFRVNGIAYENNFKSLIDWTYKKKINCRKCKIEFGLFINNKNNKMEKIIWMELLKCEDVCLDRLIKLQNNRDKYEKKNKKEYRKMLCEIEALQNKVRLDKTKVKIKAKIQNQHLFVKHA